jgi:hypothetical protein
LFVHAGEEVGVLAGEEQLSVLMAGEVDLRLTSRTHQYKQVRHAAFRRNTQLTTASNWNRSRNHYVCCELKVVV